MFQASSKRIVLSCIFLSFCSIVWAQAPDASSKPSGQPGGSQQPAGVAAKPTSPDTVVIQVGDLKITAREVEKMLESFPRQSRGFYSGPGRKQLADIIVSMKLLAKEAERRNLESREDIQTAIKIARDSILTDAVKTEMQKEAPFTDEAAQKFLDENKTKFEEAKVRRILICTQSSLNINPNQAPEGCLPDEEARQRALDIHKQLVGGADFEELAAKFSTDKMSSGKGGDLGYIKRGNQVPLIVPPVEEAIFSIDIGKVSNVIPSPFGFEIVKVEERRVPKLQDIRKQLEPQFRQAQVEQLVNEMKKKIGVVVDENFFAARPVKAPSPAKR